MGQYESVYLGEMEMAEAKRNMAGKRPNIVEGPVAPDTAKTVAFRGLTAFSGLVLTLGPIYFSFRAFLIFRASSSATWMQISVYCLFLFVEVAFSTLALFMNLLYWTNRGRYRPRQSLRALGNDLPSIDLLLPCCGEDLRIIMDTVNAAAHMDYPSDKLRLLILDDGRSSALQQEITRFQARHSLPAVHYAARGDVVRIHSKAANLDFGLKCLRQFEKGPAPFFAVLDIDMIPDRQWLRASIPVLLTDPETALVNTPQRWYNIPEGFSLSDRCIRVQDVGEHVLDSSGNANCVGTGFVARRSAFDRIGGYPHPPVLDDTCVPSYVLKAGGWQIAQLPESMQHGLQVIKLNDVAKQSAKWMIGHLATISFVFGLDMRKAPLQRKLGMIYTVSMWGMSRMLLLAATILVPVLAFSGLDLVAASTPRASRTLLLVSFLWQLSLYTQGWFERHAVGRCLSIETGQRLWVLPYEAKGALQLLEVKLFGCKRLTGFTSTGAESKRARDPLQKNVLDRMMHILWNDGAYLHAIYLLFLVLAILLSIRHMAAGPQRAIFTSFAYPPFLKLVFECLEQFTIPFQYAIFANPIADRETFLVREKETNVARPREDAKATPTVSSMTSYQYPFFVMVYYFVAFGLLCMP